MVTARLDIGAGSPADPQVIGPIDEPPDGGHLGRRSPVVGGDITPSGYAASLYVYDIIRLYLPHLILR